MIKECQHCKEKIKYETPQKLGSHIGNCKMNPNRKTRKHKLIEYTFNCDKCNNEYQLQLSENNYNKGKHSKYCSRSCANYRIITEQHKLKTSNTLKGTPDKMYSDIYYINCVSCMNIFVSDDKDRTVCNKNCIIKNNDTSKILNDWGRKGGLKSVEVQSEIRRSKNEIYFAELCEKYFNNIDCNKPIFNGWDADVIIHDIKCAVLWNGKWHYEKITEKHSVKQVQNRDKIKLKEIKTYGYDSYVIKDLGKYNPKFVEQQFEIFKKEKGLN